VTDTPDDRSARGRAIFERLRSEDLAGGDTPPESEPAGSPSTDAPPSEGEATPSEVAATEAAWGSIDPSDPDGGVPDVGQLQATTAVDAAESADAMLTDPTAPVAAAGPGTAPLPGTVDLPALDDVAPPTPADAPLAPPAPEAPTAPVPVDGLDGQPATEGATASPFARPLPRIMAVANQKGGVGKTTTAVNLGACLADIGYRVLVVDLDPQGNASTGLGINIRDLSGSMYDVILHDMPIEDCVEATSVRNLFCAPSSLDLAGAEIELVPAFSREQRLKRALEDVRDDYDFVLIDCPPSLGLLTVNGLAAATEVVVPIQCEYYALEGLGQLLRNVNLVQKNLNPVLEVSAIVLVMYDARTKLADQVVNEVREHFGAKVCRNVIPRTVRLSEAPSFGQPIIAFDSSSRGAIAYRELAKEVSGGTPQRAG
jgi:chromosome partitioning protein